MPEETRLNELRGNVLHRIERNERLSKVALFGFIALEPFFLLGFILKADLGDRLHFLLFVGFMGSYSLILLGMWMLALYLNGGNLRLLKAIELMKKELMEQR